MKLQNFLFLAILFDKAKDFKEGLAPVEVNKKWGFIDTQGKFIIKPQFDDAETFYDELAKVEVEKDGWIYTG